MADDDEVSGEVEACDGIGPADEDATDTAGS
jgi:hypothetical protein